MNPIQPNNDQFRDLRLYSHSDAVNDQLTTISISHRAIAQLPNLYLYTALKCLNFSHNQLISTPDTSLNKNLEMIRLDHNQLTSPPNVDTNQKLRSLFLSHNRLFNPPYVSHNGNLQTLDLSYNQLRASPDLRQNHQLIVLDLSHNGLVSFPDITHNRSLEYLNLSNNQLTELPDSIFSLSSECVVNVSNNYLTADYLQQFLERLEQHWEQHPGQGPQIQYSVYDANSSSSILPLHQEIDSWRKECEALFQKENSTWYTDRLSSLDQETQIMFSRYLNRLRGTRDYMMGQEPKKNIIARVKRLLQLANTQEEFRNAMLALIHEGLSSCHDRVAVIFNEIEILWHFHQQHVLDDLEQFCELCIRAERYERVKRYAKKQCIEHHLGDEIETILYFHLHLKDFFNLPITISEMRYPGCAGVTSDMIETAKQQLVEITEDELLSTSPHWQKKMQSLYPAESDAITKKYAELLHELEKYDCCLAHDRALFFQSHPYFATFLENAKAEGIQNHYDALAHFIMTNRDREISYLYQKE